jgi:outer membrane protein
MKKTIAFFLAIIPICVSAQDTIPNTATPVLVSQAGEQVVTLPQHKLPATSLNTLLNKEKTFSEQKKFGYLSYEEAMKSMPEYKEAQKDLQQIKFRYEEETKRAENEFNKKYEEFLGGEKDFPPLILTKRQKELQELMQKSVDFKDDARRQLSRAEEDLFTPVKNKLNATLQAIGKEKGYSYILNTDCNAYPYIDSAEGEDINELTKSRVR